MTAATSQQQWYAVFAGSGALGMIMIDVTGTAVALPSIQRDLMLSHGAQQWIITLYALTVAATIATGGRLADVFGRKRSFIAGVVLFALGSLLCGVSVDLPMLLCGRVLEGLGNILMGPAAALLATEAFGPTQRGRAMGIYSALGGLALVFGPIICGALVQLGGWRWAFFVNLPLAAATLLMLRAAGPATASPRGGIFRPMHSLLLAVALGPLVLGLQQSHVWGWNAALTLTLIAAGAVLLALFIIGQRRALEPLVDMRLFADRQFAADGIVLFCAQCALVGQSAFGAIYLQRILHFTPLQSGLAMLLFLLPLMLCAPLAGRLYDRYGAKLPVVTGLTLATLGLFWQTQVLPRADFLLMFPALIVTGAGMGLFLSQAYTDGTARVAEDRRGSAFGALDTVRQLGGAIGMAAIGTVVAGMERARVLDIAAKAVPEGEARAHLESLMEQAIYGKDEAVRALLEQWPAVASALRLSAAQSIGDGYYVGSGMVALGLLAAWVLMRRKPAALPQNAKMVP
ncbi:MFS transporter [Ancylobacter sp. WKF20]|uniref:MFS transporter n=1 Tax=Ancylobacter sp. WKF20 TaxID=3039801 RepID=UPI0024343E6F|nr:MFS transporter [Ancylobacter sp. WKF20]WGD31509.1 MFS transporter [Ancylobacter sp. WKF20]